MFLASMTCLAVIAVATMIVMLIAGGGVDGSQWLATLGFLAWALSPFAFLALVAWLVRAWRGASAVVLLAAVSLGAWGLYSYYDGVLVNADPQSGLYFVLMPFLQWVGATVAGLASLVAVLVARRRRKPAP